MSKKEKNIGPTVSVMLQLCAGRKRTQMQTQLRTVTVSVSAHVWLVHPPGSSPSFLTTYCCASRIFPSGSFSLNPHHASEDRKRRDRKGKKEDYATTQIPGLLQCYSDLPSPPSPSTSPDMFCHQTDS